MGGMRRMSRLAATLLVIACAGWPSTASAQERKGFWFDADFGLGSVGVSAGNFDDSRTAAGIFGLAAGWAVTPQVLVGGDIRTAGFDITGVIVGTIFISNVTGRVAYYPSPSRGFFVKGTIGGSFVDLDIEESGTTLSANVGAGLGLGTGIGYDWYLGRGFSLTPAATYWYGRIGDFRFVGQTFFTDWSHNVIDLTVAISFR